jgi:hypothetical protein
LAILHLLNAPGALGIPAEPITGITRLQKLIYLLNEKAGSQFDELYWDLDIVYVAEKFGPADLDLYRDLEFLVAAGHIDAGEHVTPEEEPSIGVMLNSQSGPLALPEEIEEEELSFDYLMAPSNSEVVQSRVSFEKNYQITAKGQDLIARLEKTSSGPHRDQVVKLRQACQEIRYQFGSWPLKRLLEHVYKNYPDMITESIIRDRVLGN